MEHAWRGARLPPERLFGPQLRRVNSFKGETRSTLDYDVLPTNVRSHVAFIQRQTPVPSRSCSLTVERSARMKTPQTRPGDGLELERDSVMRLSPKFHAAVVALVALAGVAFSSAARADSGQIWLWELKGGWFIGGSAGGGTLLFHGRRYPLSVGGVSAGLVFGGSETRLQGTVTNIWRPSDVAGVYAAAGAGVAIGVGARVIILKNEKGAVLRLSGRQIGLLANADVTGLVIGLK
jgi:hypothetical protein